MRRTFVCDEEHSAVVGRWQCLGLKDSVVACVDRHLDLKKIRQTRLKRLVEADSVASLYKDLPVVDSNAICFGSDDFLYAAAHLSLIDRLIWVLPDDLVESSNSNIPKLLWENVSCIPSHGEEILCSFESFETHASCMVNGLQVDACKIRDLKIVLQECKFHLDVDLDYFAIPTPSEVLHEVQSAGAFLRELIPYTKGTITGCYSTLSGYLPHDLRWVGNSFADKIGVDFQPRQLSLSIDEEVWRLVLNAKMISRENYHEATKSSFVQNLLGTGQSILASLAQSCGQINLAKQHWENAIAGGDRATWPAYQIARHHYLRQEYSESMKWFDRVAFDLVDRLQISAAVLAAISSLRLLDYEEAGFRANELIEAVPLLEDGYHIAIAATSALNDTKGAGIVKTKLQHLIDAREECLKICLT